MQSARRAPAVLILLGLTACSGSKSTQMLPTDTMFEDSAGTADPGGQVDSGLGETGDGGSGDGGSSDGSDEGGDSGGDPTMMVADFSLEDLNPSSLTYGQPVSPRDVLTQVSGWYFTHST